MTSYDDRYEIKECICCWYDLLGYGAPFIDAKWDLRDEKSQVNIERIKNFNDMLLSGLSLASDAQKLYINDGVISTKDIDRTSDRSLYSAIVFLDAILHDYRMHNSLDQQGGYPGIRGVITCGHRFHYDTTSEAFNVVYNQTAAYFPKAFQMNTAFSKASIMEESGSRAGIKGPYIFLDNALFDLLNIGNLEVRYAYNEARDTVSLIYDGEWFLNLFFAPEHVVYKNKGIDTTLLKLTDFESSLDIKAREQEKRFLDKFWNQE